MILRSCETTLGMFFFHFSNKWFCRTATVYTSTRVAIDIFLAKHDTLIEKLLILLVGSGFWISEDAEHFDCHLQVSANKLRFLVKKFSFPKPSSQCAGFYLLKSIGWNFFGMCFLYWISGISRCQTIAKNVEIFYRLKHVYRQNNQCVSHPLRS